ncbi:SCP-like protein [Ancylostoma caninum]|uniref:SCP-like protein n=1 Tax=Ancylostoma caninum TaxID=29170 RepID=A0A368FMK2_ANCCA|nr:SCP-like protein [Ancylostoma caninum]
MNRDPARDELLKVHNEKRAEIAKGLVKMGDGKMARPCPRMKKFVKYNCELEAAAYATASGCKTADPNAENENWFKTAAANRKDAVSKAMAAWFGEITANNAHMQQTTGSQNLLLPQLNITHFARMVWDTNTEMGCSVVQCKGEWHVACRYGQGVGKYGNMIYFMGPTCNQCGGTAKCTDGAFCN